MTRTGEKVVAVIVNYNTGGLLKEAVDSLLAGTVQPVVEIVDNASTDDSLAAIRDDAAYRGRVAVTVNEENRGFAAANNQVLRSGGAEYYLLVNPDCVIDRDAVRRLLEHVERNPEIGLAGGALMNPDGSIQKTSSRRLPTPWSSLARTLGLHRLGASRGLLADFDTAVEPRDDAGVEFCEAISGAMMFVRGSALERVGLLDEGFFMHCEDLDWCRRFRDAGYKVAYVPSARAVHAKGGSGRDPRVIWHLHRGMIRFYNKHYRHTYPWMLAALVYPAVYARCAVLMLLSLFKRAS